MTDTSRLQAKMILLIGNSARVPIGNHVHWMLLLKSMLVLCMVTISSAVFAVGGSLVVSISEEQTGDPLIARFEMHRIDAPSKILPIRRTVRAGIGVVLDQELELEMPEATYQFQLTRGPEYRVISGNFSLEPSSLDSHHVELPRMANMLAEGWVSGDCATPALDASLPLRMASEDCHVAASIGHVDAKPIAGRGDDEPILFSPSWIRHDLEILDGLAFYGFPLNSQAINPVERDPGEPPANGDLTTGKRLTSRLPIQWVIAADETQGAKIAIENPFAWQLPVWLASERIDGIFLLGDWLRLDQAMKTIRDGRGPEGPTFGDGRSIGRWAEKIYWNLLESGLRIAPLAGGGDQTGKSPVGYNRLYVAGGDNHETSTHPLHVQQVDSLTAWWDAAWEGKSVVTNGPVLRPKLAGRIPGSVFQGSTGEKLILQPELNLSVRDPVDYLEVIHNGKVHYSARLDEFAKAGGVIPPVEAVESGWITMRVVTLHENHFRAAMSAPWYIEFDSQPRVTQASVEFFQRWQAEYEERLKRLPSKEITRHVPFVVAAREFWNRKLQEVTVR